MATNKGIISTLKSDMDFFDLNIHEPLIPVPVEENEEEEERGEDGEEEGNAEESVREEEKAVSEKAESSQESFTSSLWSEVEETIPKSPDSWNLPDGTVAWDDNEKPMERLLTYADLTLTNEEEGGLLTDRIVAACGSYLTESPGNKCHVVAKVLLNNKNLHDIRILGQHRFLQYVDLSWNNLTDLTPLGCLPYLMYLDVSHNLIENVLRFNPPLNLTYVNYSYNEVWQIDDLTPFWALCYLDLSHNKISKIQGLHNLRYLRYLDLSHNKIERFENLSNMRITDLNLEYNLISRVELEFGLGMHKMPQLLNVYLNNNLITSLEFLKDVYNLRKLDLQGNNITNLVDLSNLKNLKNLRYLDMSGNPVSELKPYRKLVLNFLQELKFLDQTEVDISERIAACKTKTFDVQLEAARNHARMVLLDQLNDTSLGLDVLPVDQGPYPFIILVGPSASSKKHIVHTLATKYPDKVYAGKLHTTRDILESEKNILIHISREEMSESIKAGKFLCVTENLGHLYGFSREELGKAVKEHKLCLTALDMVAALTIHSYGFQPFLVLAIPQSTEQHMHRLRQTYGPSLSMLGAAYMKQRQLIDSHEANIKRVQTILTDLLDKIMDRLSEMILVPEGIALDVDFSTAMFDGRFGTSPGPDTPSETDRDSVYYDNNLQCYLCSPSRCGYQTCQTAHDGVTGTESQRFSASDPDTLPDSTMTSYSATPPALMKVEVSSGDCSLGEEEELFLHWCTPFIDWSEVNVSSLQLEEATEVLCNKYIENVMAMRDVYQSLHLENPGLFSLTVCTDDEENAIKDITKFMKEVWCTTPNRKPAFDVKKDLVYQAFVPQKLEKLKEMLQNDFRSSDGDGSFNGLDDFAPINSPVSIVAQMRSKGYGDFLK